MEKIKFRPSIQHTYSHKSINVCSWHWNAQYKRASPTTASDQLKINISKLNILSNSKYKSIPSAKSAFKSTRKQHNFFLNFTMNKMKPLATNQRVLTWLCVCPFDLNTNLCQKAFYIISTALLFASEVGAFVSSIIFFVENISNDLEGSLYAVFQFVAFTGLIYMSIMAFILRDRINMFLESLATIYQESKQTNKICAFEHPFHFISLHFVTFVSLA